MVGPGDIALNKTDEPLVYLMVHSSGETDNDRLNKYIHKCVKLIRLYIGDQEGKKQDSGMEMKRTNPLQRE